MPLKGFSKKFMSLTRADSVNMETCPIDEETLDMVSSEDDLGLTESIGILETRIISHSKTKTPKANLGVHKSSGRRLNKQL